MYSNKLLDWKIVSDALVEPVSLEDAKLFMNVDYSEKDSIISSLIIAARHMLESKYDIGIIEKEVQIIINNSAGDFDLPGAPIGDVSAVDCDGNSIMLSIIGDNYKYVQSPQSSYLKLIYMSGYPLTEVPEVYKTAIKNQVLWMFENLGDVQMDGKICEMAAMCLKPYRRNGIGVFI